MWPGKGKWDPWDDYVEPKGKGKGKGKAWRLRFHGVWEVMEMKGKGKGKMEMKGKGLKGTLDASRSSCGPLRQRKGQRRSPEVRVELDSQERPMKRMIMPHRPRARPRARARAKKPKAWIMGGA